MNRMRSIFVVFMACLAWTFVPLACSDNAASESIPKILPGTDYAPMYGADGGSHDRNYYGVAYSDSEATVSESYAEAGGWAGALGLGEAWAQVWRTFDALGTGGYNMRIDGYMCWFLMANSGLGLATAEAHLICRLYDVTADNYVWTVFLADQSATYKETIDHDTEYWALTKSSWLTQGHRYQIQAHCWISASAGLTAIAYADCAGEALNFEGNHLGWQGIWLNSVDFYVSGGGCVAEGTSITMDDGSQQPVETLKVGDKVLGYDPESSSFMSQTVQRVMTSKVETILNINEGALRVTLTDQPIYIRDGTLEGWVKDPIDIWLGCELYCPIEDQWISIDTLDFELEKTRVYDFTTNGYQTYLANGHLVMDKGRK